MGSEGTLRVKALGDVADLQAKFGQLKGVLGGFGSFIAGGAVAGAFAGLAKTALQAEDAQGKFMSATGASRTEAVAFSRDMNALVGSAGTVGKSFQDIADTGITVAQQFGVTGDKARDLTADVLAFAKVTGSDAVATAGQLEDTLSAFGLSADDAAGYMDKLKYSSQQFGTDAGPDTLAVLQGMAPALTAMGEDLDYGIGLLNLFETAGVNASDAQKGLNAALKQLPPGTSFDDIVANLGAIEDPIARNTEAIRLFGERVGPKLALAIQPGMTSLDDFKVSSEQSAGAVDKAASDMLTTTDKFRQFAEKIGSLFRDAGTTFGPLISAAGALGGLLGPALAKSWDAIKDSAPVKAAIQRAADVVGPLYGQAMDILKSIGDEIGKAWTAVKDLAKSAISAAASAASSAYKAALGLGQAISDALGSAWDLAKSAGRQAVELAASFATSAYKGALALGAAIGDALGSAWDAAKSFGRQAIEAAASFASSAYSGALRLGQAIGEALGAAWDAAKSFGRQAVSAAAVAAQSIYQGALKLGSAIGDALGSAWDAAKGLGRQAISAAASFAGAVYTGALRLGSAIGDALGTAWDLAKGLGRRAIEAAAKSAAVIYGGAIVLGERLGQAVSAGWQFASGAAKSAISNAGQVVGNAFGDATANAAGDAVAQGAEGTIVGNLTADSIKKGASAAGGIIGTAFGIGAIAAIAYVIIENRDTIANAFTPLGTAVDDLFDKISPISRLNKLKGEAKEVAEAMGGEFTAVMPIIKTAFDNAIAQGLSPAEAEAAGRTALAGWAAGWAEEQARTNPANPLPPEVARVLGIDAGNATGVSFQTQFQKILADQGAITATAQKYIGIGVPQAIADEWARQEPTIGDAAAFMMSGAADGIDEGIRRAVLNAAGLAPAFVDMILAGKTEIGKAGEDVGRFGADAMVDGAMKSWRDHVGPLAESMGVDFYDAWLKDRAKFTSLGEDTSGAIARGMDSAEASSAMEGHVDSLKQIIATEWTADDKAKFALGADFMKTVQKGMESESSDTVDVARSVAIEGINAIEDAGRDDKRGTERLGRLFMTLMASGMTAEERHTALAAGNVSEATIAKLETYYGDYRTTGEESGERVGDGIGSKANQTNAGQSAGDLADAAQDAFTNPDWGAMGNRVGWAWVNGLFRELTAKENFLDRKVDALAESFNGHSPPRTGPLRFIDKWGANVFAAWVDGAGGALDRGAIVLRNKLAALSPRHLPGLAPGLTVAAAAGGLGHGRIDEGDTPMIVNVNFYGPIYGGPAGLDQLTRDIADRLRQITRGANRQAANV